MLSLGTLRESNNFVGRVKLQRSFFLPKIIITPSMISWESMNIVKKKHIGFVVSDICWYKHTDKLTDSCYFYISINRFLSKCPKHLYNLPCRMVCISLQILWYISLLGNLYILSWNITKYKDVYGQNTQRCWISKQL